MKQRGWVGFLEAYRIRYQKSSGRNVELSCPLCGDDRSTNLGLSTVHSGWRCWRNSDHKGMSPVRVIAALLNITKKEAADIAEQYFDIVSGYTPKEEKPAEWVKPPDDFYDFTFDFAHEKPFLRYLKSRGLDPTYAIKRFQLKYAITGPYAGRVIVPIIQDGHWYSWVARAIDPDEPIRYKAALSKDTEYRKAEVKSEPHNHLYDRDNLLGGRLLVVTEGSFDAIAITASMIAGVQGTAIFGKEISPAQIGHLRELSKLYDNIAFGLDPDAYIDSAAQWANVRWYLPKLFRVFPNGKDWGALTPKQIEESLCV